MKSLLRFFALAVVSILCSSVSLSQISITINDSTVPVNVIQGDTISWTITLPPGETSFNQIWIDFDGNGVVSTGDRVMYEFLTRDGQLDEMQGPPDMDGIVNGQIFFRDAAPMPPADFIFVVRYDTSQASLGFTIKALTSPAYTLSGTVFAPPLTPLGGIVVRAELQDMLLSPDKPATTWFSRPEMSPIGPNVAKEWLALTDELGQFTINMPTEAGGWVWRVNVPWDPNHQLGNLMPVNDTVFTLMSSVSGIQLHLIPAKVFTGIVTDYATMDPLADARVIAEGWGEGPENVWIQAWTDSSGHYLLFVPPGLYRLSFWKESYVGEFYPQKFLRWEAESLDVSGMVDTLFVDAKLKRGGTIYGRVTRDSIGVHAGIMALSSSSPYQPLHMTWVENPDGFYYFTLPPGTYKIQFNADMQQLYFNQKMNVDDADNIFISDVSTQLFGIDCNFSSDTIFVPPQPPHIAAVFDVPNDQGKQVFVVWRAFENDERLPVPVVSYDVLRWDGMLRTNVGKVDARGDTLYSVVVPTLADSTIVRGDFITTFQVVAHLYFPWFVLWSEPMGGRSVDNLIPHTPGGLIIRSGGGNKPLLSWMPSPDDDFKYFAVFRATTPSVPTVGDPYATTIDTSFLDNSIVFGTEYFYKVVAFDFSGNASIPSISLSSKDITTGIEKGESVPEEFRLEQNYPNPFNPVTTVSFGLPKDVHTSLSVYDMLGREVVTLISGELTAGYYTVVFDASALSSGTYVYKLVAGEFTSVKKMMILK